MFSNSEQTAKPISMIKVDVKEPVAVIIEPANVATKDVGINMVLATLKFIGKLFVP
jgi:hypothetical protein